MVEGKRKKLKIATPHGTFERMVAVEKAYTHVGVARQTIGAKAGDVVITLATSQEVAEANMDKYLNPDCHEHLGVYPIEAKVSTSNNEAQKPKRRGPMTTPRRPRRPAADKKTDDTMVKVKAKTETKAKTTTKPAKPAKAAKTAAKPLNDCLCGCGGKCKGTFMPGHDAKMKAAITGMIKEGKAIQTALKALTADQRAYAKDKWIHILEKAKTAADDATAKAKKAA